MTVDVLRGFLPEDEPVGTSVAVFSAASVRADPVSFYLASGNFEDMFHVEQLSGALTVENPLDYERKKELTLLIEARDSGSPPFSSFAEIHINISDVNDNFPQFTQAEYRCEVFENSPPSWVCDVLAIDADSGSYGTVQYSIAERNTDSFFTIDPENGLLSTTANVDRENTPEFNLTIEAAEIHMRLEPYNHYPPIFLPFRPLIFTAIDQDVSNTSVGIEYIFNGGNASDFFCIQVNNGKVMLNQSLIDSVNLLFTASVIAKDQGTPSLSSQTEITFEITGRNQFPPSFRESDVIFSVPEDLPVGSVIGKIHAEDRDYGPNGAVVYCITPETHYLSFSVGEASGLLTLIRELDFEKEVIYHLQIKALDGGWVSQTGMLNVTMVIMDVNDNPPVFSSSEYTTSVPENSEIGTHVLVVKAVDADSDIRYAQISYSIIAGHVDKFAIDSRNGTITTLICDRHERSTRFQLCPLFGKCCRKQPGWVTCDNGECSG
uniref:Cadherin domain-containing protein n=1 Tax=Cyclopterus lumpus TaxID=8103 RepID=A0A8C2XCR6_CYCLU